MSEISLTLVLQIKTSKIINDMAKVLILFQHLPTNTHYFSVFVFLTIQQTRFLTYFRTFVNKVANKRFKP